MSKLNVNMLGRMLIEKRGEMGIRAVAKEIGVSPATLSRVERGFLPDLETFTKICGWLNVDPGEVLGVTGKKTATAPKVAVHFRKKTALAPRTSQALAELVLAAHRAWLFSSDES